MSKRRACLFALVLVGPSGFAVSTVAQTAALPPASIDQALVQAMHGETATGGAPEASAWTAAPSGSAAVPPGAICRMMTDLSQRTRRERICMSQGGWEALAAAARAPGRHGSSGVRLRSSWDRSGGTR